MPRSKAPRKYKYAIQRRGGASPIPPTPPTPLTPSIGTTTTSATKEKVPAATIGSRTPCAIPKPTRGTSASQNMQLQSSRSAFSSFMARIENKVAPKEVQKPNTKMAPKHTTSLPSPPKSGDQETSKSSFGPLSDKTAPRPTTTIPSGQRYKSSPLDSDSKMAPSKRSPGETAAKVTKKKKMAGPSKEQSPTDTTITTRKKKVSGSDWSEPSATTSVPATTETAVAATRTAAEKNLGNINVNKTRKSIGDKSSITTIPAIPAAALTTTMPAKNEGIKSKISTTIAEPPTTDIGTKAKNISTSDNPLAIPTRVQSTSSTSKTDITAPSETLPKVIKRSLDVVGCNNVDDPSSSRPGPGSRKRPHDSEEVAPPETISLPSFKKLRAQHSPSSKASIPRLNTESPKPRSVAANPLRIDRAPPAQLIADVLSSKISDPTKLKGPVTLMSTLMGPVNLPKLVEWPTPNDNGPWLRPLAEKYGSSVRDMMGPEWAIAPPGAAAKEYWQANK